MRALSCVPVSLALATLTLCAWSPLALADPPELDAPKPSIYGGANSETCAWPTAVSLDGCTGTLVHPEVVIYAAHCGASVSQVVLGEDGGSQAARRIDTEYCRINPAYNNGQSSGKDHAYCKLSEAVNDVPITPILMGCETTILTPGREVAVVGFGQADIQPSFGTKSEVYTTLNGISNDEASIGGGGEDACFGDSGGPVYVKLAAEAGGDDTWRVFGIVSYGAQDCLGPSSYSMMHTAMPWFESELASEGIDLTPCHDSEGNWEPTPQCQGFPLDPGTPYGSWANGCSAGAPLGGISEMCGAGFEPELDPPTVSITAPADGTQLETQGEGTVLETFTAEAMDLGSGIQHVRIQVDGADIQSGTDSIPPYEWDLALPPGGYVFTALAQDWSGNETVSSPVHVGVDQPAPDPDPTGGDDNGDGGDAGDDNGDEGGTEGGGGLDGSEGCGCTSAKPGSGGFAGLLGLVALLGLRRRRERRS